MDALMAIMNEITVRGHKDGITQRSEWGWKSLVESKHGIESNRIEYKWAIINDQVTRCSIRLHFQILPSLSRTVTHSLTFLSEIAGCC
jgi:hypothetical protein